MTEGAGAHLGQNVTGSGLQLIMKAISPSIMPFEAVDGDQLFPTAMLHDLFGPQEDWLMRGEQVAAALLRELGLRGSLHSERVVRGIVEWIRANHPDAADVCVEEADYRKIDVCIRVGYPPEFLLGLLRRVASATHGKNVVAFPDDPYRFRMHV